MSYNKNPFENEYHDEELLNPVSKFNEITIYLNHLMKEAKSIRSAAEIISRYFTDVIPIGDLDQTTIDRIACEEIADIIGKTHLAYSNNIRGSVSSAKKYLTKKFLEDYILPLQIETGTLYRINKGSLAELLSDIERLNTLYNALKSPKEEPISGDFLEIEKRKILKNLKSSKR